MTQEPELILFFDGQCPLCARERRWLERLDRHGRLAFVDIADAAFDPQPWGFEMDALMARMHAVDRDGARLEGMDVFRRAYRVLGLGWLLAWTGWPGFRGLTDLAYRIFARYRPRLSRRRCEDRCTPARHGA